MLLVPPIRKYQLAGLAGWLLANRDGRPRFRADLALYAAKRQGRNRVNLY